MIEDETTLLVDSEVNDGVTEVRGEYFTLGIQRAGRFMSRRPGDRRSLRTKQKYKLTDPAGHSELGQGEGHSNESLDHDISSSEESTFTSLNSSEEGGYSSNSSELFTDAKYNYDNGGNKPVDISEIQDWIDDAVNGAGESNPQSKTLPSNAITARVYNTNVQSKVESEKQKTQNESRLEPAHKNPGKAREKRDVLFDEELPLILSRVKRDIGKVEEENNKDVSSEEEEDIEGEEEDKADTEEEEEEEDHEEENSAAEDINIILKFRGIRFVSNCF